jgi:hypothetical protein
VVVNAEVKERTRPLFGVTGEICSRKFKKVLDSVGVVRDVREPD